MKGPDGTGTEKPYRRAHQRPSVRQCGPIDWERRIFLSQGRPTEFFPPMDPYSENEKRRWNRRPFIRKKILAKNGTAIYSYYCFAHIMRVV
jgi:hypothetical protein